MADLDRAIAIAVEAHQGQKDKAGSPYILHPLRLMLAMTDETDRIVAVLHDVVEDSEEWTLARLKSEGFAEDVLEAVDLVTRSEDESYERFIERLSDNETAVRVKLADLKDNMDITRIDSLQIKDLARLERYHAAWKLLSQVS